MRVPTCADHRGHGANPKPGTEDVVADFYRSFMDTATIEPRGLAPLAAEFARIDAIASAGDLSAYIGHNQTIGISAPVQWYVQQDAGDARRYITWLDQSGLSMPDRDYYLRTEPKYVEYRAKLAEYAAALLGAAGGADATGKAAESSRSRPASKVNWTRAEPRSGRAVQQGDAGAGGRDRRASAGRGSSTLSTPRSRVRDHAELRSATGLLASRPLAGGRPISAIGCSTRTRPACRRASISCSSASTSTRSMASRNRSRAGSAP
jgi:hypothetical protein